MVNKVIGVMIVLVIGLALLPVIGTFASNLTKDAVLDPPTPAGMYNGTTVGSLIDLLPILYVIILVAGAVGYIATSRKG